jgi:hypothetical protein
MGEFGVIIRNVKEFDKSVEEMIARVNRASEVIVRQGGQVVAREAKKIFLGSPTKKGPNGRGKGQQGQKSPSWPRPTNRTGHLRDSIRVEVRNRGDNAWESTIGPTTIYGRRVELGGTSRTNGHTIVTRPFPYMEPGFEASKPELRAIYRKVWTEAVSG